MIRLRISEKTIIEAFKLPEDAKLIQSEVPSPVVRTDLKERCLIITFWTQDTTIDDILSKDLSKEIEVVFRPELSPIQT